MLQPKKYDKNGHSLLGASTMQRGIKCALSVVFQSDTEDESSSSYSVEGSLAHALADMCLAKGDAPAKYVGQEVPVSNELMELIEKYNLSVTEDMAAHVQTYLDVVYACLAEARGGALSSEEEVVLAWIHDEATGTLDASVGIPFGTLHIFDLKYGKNVYVDARDNDQIKYYALGKVGAHNRACYTDVVMHIVQPRIGTHVDHTCEIEVDALLSWGTDVLAPAVMEVTELLDMPYHEALATARCASGDHCRWCAGKDQCTVVVTEFTGNNACQDFLGTYPEALPPLGELVEDEAELYLAIAKLISWLEKKKKAVRARVLDGERIAGVKPVVFRESLAWINEDVLDQTLPELKDQLYTRTVRTPTQVLAALAQDPTLATTADEVRQQCTKNTSYSVVSEKDKRAEAQLETAATAFGK